MSSVAKTAGNANKKSFAKNVKEYKADLKKAFNAGYVAGWNDYDKLDIRFGSKIIAVRGYNNGMRDHKRTKKYQKKAGK